ncbi:hypothetical protein BRADI_5g10763v3 [Brachypodium distachyon]|uniref:Uncharacterized protein n=1 Tax=Brachypodium distachyon TaxID=15368 RepID=A0A2K2CGH5_BRADI|nr:hypothetical protein BRADI_5g10763v3 [Brachypodium distachyon]
MYICGPDGNLALGHGGFLSRPERSSSENGLVDPRSGNVRLTLIKISVKRCALDKLSFLGTQAWKQRGFTPHASYAPR